MKVLTPNVKIKSLRKKYKITQKDLAGDSLSRSYLAMIESGKNRVTGKNAAMIVENFNKILIDRGIDDRVELKEILEGEDEQRNKIVKRAMLHLNNENTFEDGVGIAEMYLSSFTSKEKSILFKTIGDILYDKKSYERALNYYSRSLTELISEGNYKDLGSVVKGMTRIFINMLDDRRFLDLENLVKYYFDFFEASDRIVIYYNLGTLFSYCRISQRAIGYFEKVKAMISDKTSDRYFDVQNELALCYADSFDLESAERIYRSLQIKFNDPASKLAILNNMIYVRSLTNPRDDVGMKYYLGKCKSIIKKFPNYEYDERYDFLMESSELYVGIVAASFGHKKTAREFLMKVLNEKTEKNINRKINSISILLTEILDKKDAEIAFQLEDLFFNIMDRVLNKPCVVRISSDFVRYYMKYKLYKELGKFNDKISSNIKLPPKYV